MLDFTLAMFWIGIIVCIVVMVMGFVIRGIVDCFGNDYVEPYKPEPYDPDAIALKRYNEAIENARRYRDGL